MVDERMARATLSSLKRPEILDRAAAAHQQQELAFGARVGGGEHRGDARGGPFALHRRRVDDHADRAVAPRKRRQHVAQRRRGERSDHADGARMRRQRAFCGLVEQAFALQLLFQLEKPLIQRPEPRRAQRLNRELEAARARTG